MRKRKSNIDRVYEALSNDRSYPGLTASQIAAARGIDRAEVMRRVSDLKREGFTIYSNVSKRSGVPRVYYRMPA